MQKPTLILLAVALVAIVAGALYLNQAAGEPEAPVVQWSLAEEVAGSAEQAEPAASGSAGIERSEAAPVAVAPAADNEARVAALLRGRVIDKFERPVANARVWLEIATNRRGGRGSRPRRIPEPVRTNVDGRFAFQGEAFRNLRVSLQVKSERHAIGLFQRNLGDILANAATTGEVELELGDLVLMPGGLVRGRVVDLDGNAIANAEVRLEPAMRNRLRWQRNRRELLPATHTDGNGFYEHANVPAGEFSVAVLAAMHTEGRSDGFPVADEQVTEVPDVALGPGFEVTGYVRDQQGQPIARASVRLRTSANARGSRRGRGHRTETDEQGRFLLQHLPGAPMELTVDAEGFLDYRQDEVDPRSGQPIHVALQDGLRITGVVRTPTGAPVTTYALRAVRVRGLPDAGAPEPDIEELRRRMRDRFADRRGNRFRGQRGRRGSLGESEPHAGGRFVAGNLQEGIYEVLVQADGFARYQSDELQVRRDVAAPEITITLDPGLYVGGVVLDQRGDPVANARVELRSTSLDATRGASGRPDGSGRAGFDFDRMARQWARGRDATAIRLEARTDEDGVFLIRHVPRGVFALSATKDGFTRERTDPFELTTDRSDIELRLQPLGSLVGVVTGFERDELAETRVGAIRLSDDGRVDIGGLFGGRGGRGGGRGFRTVNVEQDGSYRLDGLLPGNYAVRSWVGSPQQLMRELGPDLMSGNVAADVAVRGGSEARWDLHLTRPQLGGLSGTVSHNGAPATGFRVELRRQQNGDPPAASPFGGGGRGRRMAGFFGGRHQATVQASGRFAIEDVPAGTYTLHIAAARTRGALHEEPITILADTTTERSFALVTGSLQGTLATDDGTDTKSLGGRISLLPEQSAVPQDLNRWLREHRTFDARVRDGAFTFPAVPPGNYLLVAQVRGRETVSMPLVVTGEERLTLPVGKAKQQNGGAPK